MSLYYSHMFALSPLYPVPVLLIPKSPLSWLLPAALHFAKLGECHLSTQQGGWDSWFFQSSYVTCLHTFILPGPTHPLATSKREFSFIIPGTKCTAYHTSGFQKQFMWGSWICSCICPSKHSFFSLQNSTNPNYLSVAALKSFHFIRASLD